MSIVQNMLKRSWIILVNKSVVVEVKIGKMK